MRHGLGLPGRAAGIILRMYQPPDAEYREIAINEADQRSSDAGAAIGDMLSACGADDRR